MPAPSLPGGGVVRTGGDDRTGVRAVDHRGTGDPGDLRARNEYRGDAGTIGAARDAAAAYATALQVTSPAATPDARDNLLLVVSELVTNAVRHAPGRCALELSHQPGAVVVEVSDTSSRPPRFRPADFTGGGGFGWPLVHRLAAEVNVVVRAGGKDVRVLLPW